MPQFRKYLTLFLFAIACVHPAWAKSPFSNRTIFIIVMENTDWAMIRGNPNAAYINNVMLPMSSYCDEYHTPPGLRPSEPNYLWIVGGTNYGIADNSPPAVNHTADTNITQMLDAAGLTWKAYMEDLPSDPLWDSYPYAVRHNPFVYMDYVYTNSDLMTAHIRPHDELAGDLDSGEVANYNFITPNVINDMHDLAPGSDQVTQGDTWLAREIPLLTNSTAYKAGGIIFVVWDEGTKWTIDQSVPMIVISPLAKGNGYHNSIIYSHSSLLRTTQDIFGLRPYLGDAVNARSLDELFRHPKLDILKVTPYGAMLRGSDVPPIPTQIIEFSRDLINWQPIRTNDTSMDSLLFQQSLRGTDMSHGFYRIRPN